MQFEYVSEEELEKEFGKTKFLLEEGLGTFSIKKAEQTVSEKGNEMLKLTLEVVDKNEKTGMLFDYILSTNKQTEEKTRKFMAWKLKSVAKSVGHPEFYKEGREITPNEWIDKKGSLLIKTQKSEQYGDKSKVDGYVLTESLNNYVNEQQNNQAAQSQEESLDDIPF